MQQINFRPGELKSETSAPERVEECTTEFATKRPRVVFWEPQLWEDFSAINPIRFEIVGDNKTCTECARRVWLPCKLQFRSYIGRVLANLHEMYQLGARPETGYDDFV